MYINYHISYLNDHLRIYLIQPNHNHVGPFHGAVVGKPYRHPTIDRALDLYRDIRFILRVPLGFDSSIRQLDFCRPIDLIL